MNHWLLLGLVLLAHLAWVLFIRWLSARGVDSETTRKVFHSGIGTQLLALPLLFQQDAGPVLVWGVLGVAGMVALLLSPELRDKLAGNVYDVERVSYGDLYFVIGVVLLFLFAAPTYYTYAVPLTMLAFADAVSALVGKRIGRHKFEAVEGRKSIEGSLAFFAVAFVAAIAWAPALPNANPAQVALIAVSLGLVVMLLEAISWRGLDNLLIPLGGFLLLRTYLMMDLRLLILNLAVVTLLVAFTVAWRRRSTLNHSALITGALFGYTAWTVASAVWDRGAGLIGWAWLAAPLLLFLLYNLLIAPRLLEEHHEKHNIDAVFGAVFAGALWLYIAFYFNRPEFVFPYCASFACVGLNMYFERRENHQRRRGVFLAMSLGALVMLGCGYGVLYILDAPGARVLFGGLLGAAVSGVLASMLLRQGLSAVLDSERYYRWRWHIRGLGALAGSIVAALPLATWTVTQT